MSKIIATKAIRGAHELVKRAEKELAQALEEKGSDTGPGWINAGVYIINKSLVASIPAGIEFSLERQFFPGLLNKGLYGFCSNGRFIDIGTPQSLRAAQKFFEDPSLFYKNSILNSGLKEIDK